MDKRPTHKLSLAVQYACAAQNLPTRAQLRSWVKIALRRDATMTLRIVDKAEGRELNRKYRSKDYATNVLTFVYNDADPPHPHFDKLRTGLPGGLTDTSPVKVRLGGATLQPLQGDVVICAPVVEREAATQHKNLLAHYAHLTVHATLHLQGYDHENDADAEEMEALETAIMLKLHRPDPYQETSATNERPRK